MATPCPFTPPTGDVITHEIPVHLREKIAELWEKRAELCNFKGLGMTATAGAWYRAMTPVVEAFDKIENELRSRVNAPPQSCIEYYSDWRFRCPDYNTLHAEYLARCEKK